MRNRFLLIYVLSIFSCGLASAQEWSKEDSIWLIDVLEGKEIKINEDTKRAIENGLLIVPSWMRNEDGVMKEIEIIKDFSSAGVIDSARIHSIDPYSMPPAIYAMYVLYMEKMDSVFEGRAMVLSNEEKEKFGEMVPYGTGSVSLRTSNMASGLTTIMDFNHMLSMVFSPVYRNRARNAKNATAYKNYYDEFGLKPMRMTERERMQLRKATYGIKSSSPNIRTSENRRNGIDN